MRIVTAMLKHETNSFSPIPTDLARFQAWGCHHGAAAYAAMRQTRMPMAAYLARIEAAGHEAATPLAAEAMPSGPVAAETYAHLTGAILEEVARGCDAVMLDLHGAMIAEGEPDGEGALLEAIRRIRPGIPIAVTCDLHANVTARMLANCTALIGYKTYPHTDLFEVADQVAAILLDHLDGRCDPVMAWRQPPLLAHTLMQGSDMAPMGPLQARARSLETRPAIRAATLFGGFNLGDMADAGSSVVVIADGDQVAADRAADDLAGALWAARDGFIYRGEPIEAALARAARLGLEGGGPVVLLDHADNCGSGGTQDVMGVIAAVLRADLPDVAMAAVWDPDAAHAMHRAGVGATLTLDLGGRTAMPALGLNPDPLRLTGQVVALSDGRWRVEGPMYTGVEVEMGPSALFRVGGMEIVVVSRHHEPWDVGVFHALGVDPPSKRFLLLKSRVHYRAGFGAMERARVALDGQGVTTSDWLVLPYRGVRRPIYPLDEGVTWS